MREIDINRIAWGKLSKEHFEHFRRLLKEKETILNPIIIRELGDICGKSLMHLQCNTGADTVCLARLGAKVSGLDLVPDNVMYAKQLAQEFGFNDAMFYEDNVLDFASHHDIKYDIVFTSEGVIGWLPDLKPWAKTISHLLKPGGMFYINEIHPFYLMLDEGAFVQQRFEFKYPYFGNYQTESNSIGGYATPSKQAKAFDWMHSFSEIIGSLIDEGLEIVFLHEFDTLCEKVGSMEEVGQSQYRCQKWKDKLPMQFSLMARLPKNWY